jgi:hypothetical protein
VSLDDQLRQEFSRRHGILAFDAELDAVVESIYGNRKDQVTTGSMYGVPPAKSGVNPTTATF